MRHVVVDAVADTDLGIIGEATGDDLLVTGGSGVALGLPAAYRRRGLLPTRPMPIRCRDRRRLRGACRLLLGGDAGPDRGLQGAAPSLDTDAICRGEPVGEKALAWAKDKLGNGPILFSASDKPEAVKALQSKYGIEKSSQAIEKTMATLAKGLVAAGVGRMVVAGRRDLGCRGRRTRRDGVAHVAGREQDRAVAELVLGPGHRLVAHRFAAADGVGIECEVRALEGRDLAQCRGRARSRKHRGRAANPGKASTPDLCASKSRRR